MGFVVNTNTGNIKVVNYQVIDLIVKVLKQNNVHNIFVPSPAGQSASAVLYDPSKWEPDYGPATFTDRNGPFDCIESIIGCDYFKIIKPQYFVQKVNRWGEKEWHYKGNAEQELIYQSYCQDEQDNVMPVVVFHKSEEEGNNIILIGISVD